MKTYQNGNAQIELHNDGTRIIQFENQLELDYPLNIDIRVATKCTFGLNPKTGKSFCDFCHESATTDGDECDYQALMDKLKGLPEGIELAVGGNNFTSGLYEFILWCNLQGYVVNLTINQGHLKRDFEGIKHVLECGFIGGLGVSYRSSLKWDVTEFIVNHPNTVFHVITGIDTVEDVLSLKEKGVKKVLILGEKNFGFNKGKVDLTTQKHKEWFWWIGKLFDQFEVVSFDNLALEQLKMRRFFNEESWEIFDQGEHSFYINAVDQYFAPSSRSPLRTSWENTSVKDFFKTKIEHICFDLKN